MSEVADPALERQKFMRWTALATVVTLLVAVVLAAKSGTWAAKAVGDIGQLLAAAAASAACLRAGRRQPSNRRAWGLLGASAAVWATGAAIWLAYGLTRDHIYPFPSVADVCFLGYSLLAVAGLLSFPLPGASPVTRFRTILDASAIAAAVFFISWATVLAPVLHAPAEPLARVVAVAYPAVDIVLVSLILALAMRQRPGTRLSFALLGGGLLILSVTDSVFAARTLNGVETIGTGVMTGWVASWLAVGLAALVPSRPLGKDSRRVQVLQELTPYAPVLVAVLISGPLRITLVSDPVLFVTGVAVVSFLTVRQILRTVEHVLLANDLEAIVERRTAELRTHDERFASLVQNSSDVITVIDERGLILYQSPSVERIFGRPADTLTGTNWFDQVQPGDHHILRSLLREVAEQPLQSRAGEIQVTDSSGAPRHVEVRVTNFLDDETVSGLVLNVREIAERKALESQMRHQAFHDSLTGLANRTLFIEHVRHALARAGRSGEQVAVLFLDLDDFKEVNDTLGHAYGDELLIDIAIRLRRCLRPADTIARLGGDEFAILLEDYSDSSAASALANRILHALREPMELSGNQVVTHASIGIAVGGAEAEVDDLLRNADLAMYAVKGQGKGSHATFAPEMHETARARLELLADLRGAVGTNEMVLHYQPKFSLRTDNVLGFEALVRWNHPRRGLVSPGDFIPLAEETGLIVPLGAWVLQEACRQLAEWTATAPIPGSALTMAVNLSARQLAEDDLVDVIAEVLRRTPLAPGLLELEITETAIMEDVERVLPVLQGLKRLGVSLAIDDFGTGYSSLNYLKRFPVDTLKIDRAFVGGLGRDVQDSALVTAVIALAKSLGMSSVAEGVETIEQLVELSALGCDEAQGFYLGRPLPAGPAGELVIAVPHDQRPTIETVLVCDDDSLIRTLFKRALEHAGMKVHEAVDGHECLEMAERYQPDLIVLDLQMPNLDGMSALAKLKECCPAARVVIVSGTPSAELVDQGLHLGAAAFFDKAGFVPRIPELLAQFGRLTEAAA